MKAVPHYLAHVVGSSPPSARGVLRPPHFPFGPVGLPLSDGAQGIDDVVGTDNPSPNEPGPNEPNRNQPAPDEPGPSAGPRAMRSQIERETASQGPISASRPVSRYSPFDQAPVPAVSALSGSVRPSVGRDDGDAVQSLVNRVRRDHSLQIEAPGLPAPRLPTVPAAEVLQPVRAEGVTMNVPTALTAVVGDSRFERRRLEPKRDVYGEGASPPVTALRSRERPEPGPQLPGPVAHPKLTDLHEEVASVTGSGRDEPNRDQRSSSAGPHPSSGDPLEALLPVPGFIFPSQTAPDRPPHSALSFAQTGPSLPLPGPVRVTIGTIEVNVVPAPPPAPLPFPPAVSPAVHPAPARHRTVVDVARSGAGRWFGTGQG